MRGKAIYAAITVAGVIITQPTFGYSEKYEQCVNSIMSGNGYNGYTKDIYPCVEEELKRSDKTLGEKYHELLDSLATDPHDDPEIIKDKEYEKQQLVNSERAWIKFRDANCEFMKMEPTGVPGISKVQCLLAETVSRIDELDRMFPR